ncbi:MAG: BrnA antitoxin family protein [SAR324 cluster bacterium]|nr:BrnA antitoxin family protein [SAR324 cluster bacterium]
MKGKQENITRFTLNKSKLPALSKSHLNRLDGMTEMDIDYSDIPDLTENEHFWKSGQIALTHRKSSITTRIDSDVLEWFKSQGKGYQTKINSILRAYMKAHT